MIRNRIDILKDILLDLHNGASPESVQEQFNQHFKGVSALEISLMEHELMSSDTGITFEDVMSLCNVHANLFKGSIATVDTPDVDQEGHPVYVFKQENLALRAAILRIRRIMENLAKPEQEKIQEELFKGLKHQIALLGQFDNHYNRKEQLFFPIMERYGHDAPPKVMWGVDDQIRDLFKKVRHQVESFTDFDSQIFSEAFDAFSHEFEEMIFKEEAILLMILLETLTQDDWLSIAKESDTYGYAIIKPTATWQPHRHDFTANDMVSEQEGSKEQLLANQIQDVQGGQTRVIETPEGTFSISFTPKEKEAAFDVTTPQAFGNGYLSVQEANLILNHLPLEITFVNKEDIFQYYNDSVPAEEMIFKRSPSQIGRHVELCHPPKVLDKVKKIFELLRSGQRDKVVMWFKSEKMGKFVHVTYAAVRDENGEFQGVLEYVQDIQEFFELEGDSMREI
ncbi:DUF438 domain-containing protein [Streptococcus plurextorum]|uniref:DUF438 domain-containing protein n=1 Tax=Streptococcus plurextorum TaxID=456876 RepID=UPI00040E2DFA|nr:DUF438 domain-containing protein [Streptococcus plurextorum]